MKRPEQRTRRSHTRGRVLLALGVCATATSSPGPAQSGLLGDLFGGGGDSGGCTDSGAGLLDTLGGALGVPTGDIAGAVGTAGADVATDPASVAGAAVPGASGGCPVVESEPFVVEGIVKKQELELVLQTAHMVTQIENLIQMRALAGLDQRAEIAGRITDARRAVGLVERVLWSLPAADADFQTLYPYALPTGLDAVALAGHQAEQARLARESSRASKLISADAVTGVETYPARTEALMAAAKLCEGQTCALDTNTQATLLDAEIGSQLLLMQAAHYRAVEAQLDYEQAAVERAVQHTLINWRGLDTYGGPES